MSTSKKNCSGSEDSSDVIMADGGYGWVIVGASFFNMFCLDGLIGVYGLMYPDLLAYFGEGPAFTALPGSLITGMFLLFGPISSALIRRFSFRVVPFLGACISGVGLICSCAAPTFYVFLFTHGILTGIGCGLFYLPSAILVNMYFDRKRGIAQGIITAGSGFGMIVMSPLTKLLLEYYGWRGTFLLWGGLLFNICVTGMLMRPPTKGDNQGSVDTLEMKVKTRDESFSENKPLKEHSETPTSMQQNGGLQNKFLYVRNIEHSSTSSLPHWGGNKDKKSPVPDVGHYLSLQCVHNAKPHSHAHKHTRNQNMLDRKDIFLSGSTHILRKYISHRSFYSKDGGTYDVIDRHHDVVDSTSCVSSDDDTDDRLWKGLYKPFMSDPAFLLLVAGSALAQMAQFVPMVFMGDYCNLLGLEGRDTATLFVIFGVVNTAGRLAAGALANTQIVSALFVCNFGTLVCAIALFLFWLCTTFETLALFMVILGFFIGFSAPTQPLIALEYLGLDNLTPAFGLITMAKGPAAIAGPPLAGGLYQLTKNYSYSNMFAGSLMLLTAILMSFMPVCGKSYLQKQELPATPLDIISGEHGDDTNDACRERLDSL